MNPNRDGRYRLLAELLRDLRRQAGMTQVELARRLRRPQSFVSKYESSDRRLDVIELHEISSILGTSLTSVARRLEGMMRTRPGGGR